MVSPVCNSRIFRHYANDSSSVVSQIVRSQAGPDDRMSTPPIAGVVRQKARRGMQGLGLLALLMLIFASIVQVYQVVIVSLLFSKNLILLGAMLFALIPFVYMAVHTCILCSIVARRVFFAVNRSSK